MNGGVCLPCEQERARLKTLAYNKTKERAIEYAKTHGLTQILIVQTKNHPGFKRADDPEAARFPIIEVILL
jgi:hypothetical protein